MFAVYLTTFKMKSRNQKCDNVRNITSDSFMYFAIKFARWQHPATFAVPIRRDFVFAIHVLTVAFAPNQEATSLLHGPVSDLLTELSPFQRHLLGTHCQLIDIRDCSSEETFKKHLKTRLSCFM